MCGYPSTFNSWEWWDHLNSHFLDTIYESTSAVPALPLFWFRKSDLAAGRVYHAAPTCRYRCNSSFCGAVCLFIALLFCENDSSFAVAKIAGGIPWILWREREITLRRVFYCRRSARVVMEHQESAWTSPFGRKLERIKEKGWIWSRPIFIFITVTMVYFKVHLAQSRCHD